MYGKGYGYGYGFKRKTCRLDGVGPGCQRGCNLVLPPPMPLPPNSPTSNDPPLLCLNSGCFDCESCTSWSTLPRNFFGLVLYCLTPTAATLLDAHCLEAGVPFQSHENPKVILYTHYLILLDAALYFKPFEKVHKKWKFWADSATTWEAGWPAET